MSYGTESEDVAPFLMGSSGSIADPSGIPFVQALAQDRQRFLAELQDPDFRRYAKGIMAGENNGRTSNLGVLESAMNRASMMGTTLKQELKRTADGGYYAGYRPSAVNDPRFDAMMEQNITHALNGSNSNNWGTDNSSGQWGRNRIDQGMFTLTKEDNGELFQYPSRTDARGWNRYQAWRDNLSGAPNNTLPATAEDQLTASLAQKQTTQPSQAPVAATAVADASQTAAQKGPLQSFVDAESAKHPALSSLGSVLGVGGTPSAPSSGGVGSAVASAMGLPPVVGSLVGGILGGHGDSSTSDDKAVQDAMRTTAQAAANPGFMALKPIDMSRVAAVIQRLQGQGPMGLTEGNGLGTAQQQALGSYFGTIG